MQPIQDTKAEDLLKQASDELLEESRRDGIMQIKKIYIGIRQLSQDIVKKEKELGAMRASLEKKQADLDRLKAGDWSVLKDEKGGSDKPEQPQA